jgi:5'-nucleotidase / UDP-sugar diphosphatase
VTRRLALLALALVLVLGAGCAGAPRCAQAPARVQLLLVNDVYLLEPRADGTGGLARVATLVRGLRRAQPNTLFVLAGDTLSPSLLSTLFRGRQMVEAWNLLELDAATFGNHEFDWGPAVLRERMLESRFLWLSANVLDRRTRRPFGGAWPWLARDLGGVRVGMVGLTLPETQYTSNPGPEVSFEVPRPAARAAFEAMGPVDLRVAVTHLELAGDRALADAVPIHVILGGHDHDPTVVEQGGTLIVKAGSDAMNVGQVELELACGTVLARRHRLIPVTADIVEATDVRRFVQRYAALTDQALDRVAFVAGAPLEARDAVVRRLEVPLGRLVAEVMRERLDAEAALLNSGSLRANRVFSPGPVTRRDIRALLPFANTMVLLEVPGTTLRAALEHSVSALPQPAGRFLQTAGLRYSVDPERPPGARVGAVEVQGQPLEPGRAYRVAVTDFLARGGDGYAMLAAGRVVVSAEEGPGLIETVLEAVEQGRLP